MGKRSKFRCAVCESAYETAKGLAIHTTKSHAKPAKVAGKRVSAGGYDNDFLRSQIAELLRDKQQLEGREQALFAQLTTAEEAVVAANAHNLALLNQVNSLIAQRDLDKLPVTVLHRKQRCVACGQLTCLRRNERCGPCVADGTQRMSAEAWAKVTEATRYRGKVRHEG